MDILGKALDINGLPTKCRLRNREAFKYMCYSFQKMFLLKIDLVISFPFGFGFSAGIGSESKTTRIRGEKGCEHDFL